MMQRRKRPFYIIGHNPNTITEAKEFLQAGANALEPDIIYSGGRFLVSHSHHTDEDTLTIELYLQQLKALLENENYKLALLIFDIKDTDFDINDFISIVKENFQGPVCEGVAILMTHADDHEFVARYRGQYPNVGIGVDESNVPPTELDRFFKNSGQKNFAYADGITTILNKLGVYDNVREAQQCRDKSGGGFALVYTWVLSLKGSMRKYLDTYIDGIFVDLSSVKELLELIGEAPYNEVFELAANGYNPFGAPPVPGYTLSIKTADQAFAGTDARILFTLKDAAGQSLQSLPYDGSLWGALERDSTTLLSMEGLELQDIRSLTIEALTDGPGSAWLPEQVIVESRSDHKKICFAFNGDQLPEAWVSLKDGPITRSPS